ncbi:porin [Curvivirga aplysinae]|uniref:porin n=1 Tax=Curvivirga aplysinae TaxID=2529852 RepID=UPI0012BD297E|nr:porin [Curvivirga aplysinae]MTI09313.1 porin [Curvivirga aplysinae]
MRKILLATSALVAGSAVAASASAAEAPTVSLSGGIDIQYIAETNDTSDNRTDKLGYLPFMTALIWDIDAEADNGLAYGGRIDWRPANSGGSGGSGSNLDEIWIDLKGSFGKVVLGNDDGVGDDNVPQGGSVLVGSFGWTGTYLAGRSNSQLKGGAPAPDGGSVVGTSDAAKVSYYTPDFGGFSAGFSWTPDSSISGSTTETANTTTGEITSSTAKSDFDNHYELMVSYSGEFAGASVTAAGQYKMADAQVDTNEDVRAWEVGTTVGIAGFSIGASYFDNGDSLVAKSSTADAGDGFTLGVAYSFGATAVSVGYAATELDDGAGTTDEYDNLSLDVEYTVAEGLSAYAGVQFAESDDGSDATSSGEEDSTAVIIGTRLSF